MSGRRRMKNIHYDEDDYWDDDSDDLEADEDEEDKEKKHGGSSATSKHGTKGTSGQTTAKRGGGGEVSGRADTHTGVPAKGGPANGSQRKNLPTAEEKSKSLRIPASTPVQAVTPAAGNAGARERLPRPPVSEAGRHGNNSRKFCSQGETIASSKEGAASVDREGSFKRESVGDATSGDIHSAETPGLKDRTAQEVSGGKKAEKQGEAQAKSDSAERLNVGCRRLPSTSCERRTSRAEPARILSSETTERVYREESSRRPPAVYYTTKDEEEPDKETAAEEAHSAAVDDYPDDGSRPPYSLVVIGHVDAGKSTLTGQLLFLTGAVTGKEVDRLKRLSSTAGKSSFFYAWLCDEGDDERQRGVTIDVSCRVIITAKEHRRISFLDAPGHHELVSNMLGGAVLADAALLVVDAAKFDAGFQGQTKEHLLIARSLNIQHFVVAVNKMDAVDWCETAYNEVVERLQAFLTGPEISCPAKQIHFVPLSALVGVNVADEETTREAQARTAAERKPRSTAEAGKESVCSMEMQQKLLHSWWKGSSLLDLLESLQINPVATQRQLRAEPFAACVADMWSVSSSSEDLNMSFKVASGTLRVGEKVGALPANVVLVCKALSSYGEETQSCASGDFVERGVFSHAHSPPPMDKQMPSAGIEAVGVGTVLCSSTRMLHVLSSFLCKIVVFSRELPLMPGRQLNAYIHTMTCQCIVRRVVAAIDKKTGAIVKEEKQARRCALVFGMAGVIEIVVAPGKVCVRQKSERREQTSVLSRIILRDSYGTAAAGVVVRDVDV